MIIVIVRDAGTRKGPGGADFVEGHRQNFNYVKIHTLEFRGSVAFFLRQILTNHILSMASAITLDINTSQISSIDSAQRILLSLTKGTSKTVYIIFFILKGHFCPPCPSQQKARGAAAPPAPPPQFRRPWSSSLIMVMSKTIINPFFREFYSPEIHPRERGER